MPGAARFLTQDPIGFTAGDPNIFRYIGNAPTASVDPTGLDSGMTAGDYAALYCHYSWICQGIVALGNHLGGLASDILNEDPLTAACRYGAFNCAAQSVDGVTSLGTLPGLGPVIIVGSHLLGIDPLQEIANAIHADGARDGAIAGPLIQAVVGAILGGLVRLPATTRPPVDLHRAVRHHSDPKFMGGARNQPLTVMPEPLRKQLHKDLNNFLDTKTNPFGKSMRPKPGNSADDIQTNFFRSELLDAMAERELYNLR